jgi:hypothetical protein
MHRSFEHSIRQPVAVLSGSQLRERTHPALTGQPPLRGLATSAAVQQRRAESIVPKHAAAVAKTLQYAVDAAAGGDYPDALAWLATVEAIGDVLPDEYETKRAAWILAAQTSR